MNKKAKRHACAIARLNELSQLLTQERAEHSIQRTARGVPVVELANHNRLVYFTSTGQYRLFVRSNHRADQMRFDYPTAELAAFASVTITTEALDKHTGTA